MHIICLVKFIPDVDNFEYDYERNVLMRENVSTILNPDDACALAYALKLKQSQPDTTVEVVSMAPLGISQYLKDLLRRGADSAALISDSLYIGSDTYATSQIIAKYLNSRKFDLILSGTHSLDGDTAHVPTQIAELLNIPIMTGISKIEQLNLEDKYATIQIEEEKQTSKYQITLPSVLGLSKNSDYKLPFVRYADLELNVDERLKVISNKDLSFKKEEVGLKGSQTKVASTYTRELGKREHIVVKNDSSGIEFVYSFLKEKGFV